MFQILDGVEELGYVCFHGCIALSSVTTGEALQLKRIGLKCLLGVARNFFVPKGSLTCLPAIKRLFTKSSGTEGRKAS